MRSIITISASGHPNDISSRVSSLTDKVQVRFCIIQDKAVKYIRITMAEIPNVIKMALFNDYPNYRTKEALKGDDSTYKLAIIKDRRKIELIFNRKGDILKTEIPDSNYERFITPEDN